MSRDVPGVGVAGQCSRFMFSWTVQRKSVCVCVCDSGLAQEGSLTWRGGGLTLE